MPDFGRGGKSPDFSGGMNYALSVLVLDDAPFSLMIGEPQMKTVTASLNFDADTASIKLGSTY